MDIAKTCIQRLEEMKSERQCFESEWRECYEMAAPERLPDFNGVKDDTKRIRAKLFDTTGADATQVLASSIVSGTTPANAIWFKAVPDGVDDQGEITEGERWLDNACRTMWRNIHGSNFDSEIPDTVLDSIVAGWGVLYISEDEEDGFVFENWSIGNTYISSTKRSGMVDVVYRVHSMTAKAIVNEYGESNVHRTIYDACKKEPDKRFDILHVIQPRKDKDYENNRSGLPERLPFASYHIDLCNKVLIKESGYREFPCAIPRLYKKASSFYAVGQVSKALPSMKTLNAHAKMMLESAEMSIFGMWAARDDGVLNPSSLKIGARKLAIVNDMESIKRIDGAGNYQLSQYEADRLERAIKRALMADQLHGVDGPAMTATEVTERVNLIRQQLGPMFGRWQSELLSSILARCFAIEMERGTFGEIPDELKSTSMQFKFINPLARSQQLEEVASTEMFINSLAAIANVEPTALDNVNFDSAVNVVASGRGIPDSIMRSAKEVANLREARQKAQEQQAQQQQQQQIQQGVMEMAGKAALNGDQNA